jgi:hypothetical protein
MDRAGVCAERWIRTLRSKCLWAELQDTVDELRQAVAGFVQSYNSQWLIGRLAHRTPKEAYQDATTTAAAQSGRHRAVQQPGAVQHLLTQLTPSAMTDRP